MIHTSRGGGGGPGTTGSNPNLLRPESPKDRGRPSAIALPRSAFAGAPRLCHEARPGNFRHLPPLRRFFIGFQLNPDPPLSH
jgi:hypothetical protein